jgi:uncharacterized protein
MQPIHALKSVDESPPSLSCPIDRSEELVAAAPLPEDADKVTASGTAAAPAASLAVAADSSVALVAGVESAALDDHDASISGILSTTTPAGGPEASEGSAARVIPLVPWGLGTTVGVMIAWLFSFWGAAYVAVPSLLVALGLDAAVSSGRVQAFRHLVLDLTQLGITALVLRRGLQNLRPLPEGLFAWRWRPLREITAAVAVGCAFFPLVDWIHRQMVGRLSGVDTAASAADHLAAGDWPARLMWVTVLAVCAPVWEETMFRGFLLPSLARYLPPWGAIIVTSLVFALVHFSKEGFLPLLVLGVVFGGVYVRTLNLLPAVLLHSLWNVWLLAQVFSAA